MDATARSKVEFGSLVNMPDFLISWADRFYESQEIELIHIMSRDVLDAAAVKARWELAPDIACPQEVEALLKRSFKRGVLNKDDSLHYTVADFHARYDVWALFESWQDIPDDIQYLLNQWELDFYRHRHRNLVEDLKHNRARDIAERWPEYLLLHEAETLIDAVAHVYLWPCNCRAMMGNCRNPIYTCLRFSNNRGLGWEISKHRAKEIMREANRKGLMQNGEISVMPDGAIDGALCNCCADCCFPHLLAERLHAEKLWPLTRYLAHADWDACTGCGRCVRRCPFDAITLDKPGNELEKAFIRIDGERCRGCGVCSTGCKEEAISMVKLDGVDSLFDKQVS